MKDQGFWIILFYMSIGCVSDSRCSDSLEEKMDKLHLIVRNLYSHQ